jgi:hypothetical protein
VTVAKWRRGDAGAVFDLAPKVGSLSDRRAANGGVMACVKKAKKHNLNEAGAAGGWPSRGGSGPLPHSKRGAGEIGAGHGIFRMSRAKRVKISSSPGKSRDVKRNEVEWSALEFRRGASMGEPSLSGFGGVVWKGKPKPGSLGDRGNEKCGLRGPRCPVAQTKGRGVEPVAERSVFRSEGQA